MTFKSKNSILNDLKNYRNILDEDISKYLRRLNTPKVIKDIMSYAVLGGGKRIRPYLLAEIAKLYGVEYKIYKYPCMAIELAHCFSLVYDDLPCMDDDDLRRGRVTVHKAFNEANALLGGASLLVYSFKILSLDEFQIHQKDKLKIIKNFSDATGAEGVLAGQYLDLEAENKNFKLTMTRFNEIQEKKTSLLIAFCTLTGAILGKAKIKEQKEMFKIGLLIGRIFQIQDDILDLEGNEKEMGKKINKDQKSNKATIIRLKNLNYAKKEVKNLSLIVKQKLVSINKKTKKLEDFIDFLKSRTA